MAAAGELAAGDPAVGGRARCALLPGWLAAAGKAGCRRPGKREVHDEGALAQTDRVSYPLPPIRTMIDVLLPWETGSG